jgi:hypothetical protein
MRDLSAAQRLFVSVLVETGIPAKAEAASGLSAGVTLANLAVQRATRDALAQRLLRVAPSALSVLERLAIDESIPPAVRRLAASDLLDRVGLVSQTALALSRPIESLSEMPAQELRALVQRLESELFARATPVRELELVPSVLD